MKSLIIVSAAVGVLSGTSIKAQTSINLQKFASANAEKKQLKFIESIETKQETVVVQQPAAAPVVAKADVVRIPATTVKLAKSKGVSKAFSTTIEECTPLQFKYAQLMNSEVENVTDIKLFEFVDDWWGTRYSYGGMGRRGIDCSALTGKLLKEVYAQEMPRTAREQFRVTQRISRNELVEGDLVFFNTRGGVSHVGVYVGNDCFVHASCSKGVTISSLNDNYYSSKYIGAGRYIAPVEKTVQVPAVTEPAKTTVSKYYFEN